MAIIKETGAKRKLDDVFSRFIRMRDADVHGLITCVSCKTKIKWEKSNCCHYADRHHIATRWDETNCHAGCTNCNCFNKSFHLHQYAKFLNETYGSGTADAIIQKSQIKVSFTSEEMEKLVIIYKNKIKEYEKN